MEHTTFWTLYHSIIIIIIICLALHDKSKTEIGTESYTFSLEMMIM